MIEPPRFKHDCTGCRFIGRSGEFDIWFCESKNGLLHCSVIGRYGSEGWEYQSMPLACCGRVRGRLLREAPEFQLAFADPKVAELLRPLDEAEIFEAMEQRDLLARIKGQRPKD